ncbi:MAG: flavin reductase family protein, partial [Chloroflexi bacterium]|nr:flavin reductase family protein [Chloroflexota bacterium]
MLEEVPLHLAHRLLVCGPVLLITAAARGREDVTTVAWAMPVSQVPPYVAVAIYPSRLVYELIKRSEQFAINIPNLELAEQVQLCGTLTGYEVDKLRESQLTMTAAKVIQAPLIEECIGHLECGVVSALEPGDHAVFIAETLAAWAKPGLFRDGWTLDVPKGKPIHHLGGTYYAFLERRLDLSNKATLERLVEESE